jgi:hypothetical protein
MTQHYGYDLRDDSFLAYRFCVADNDLEPMWQDMVDVAHELACIQTLHDCTPYDQVCQDTLRRLAGALNAGGIPWKVAWERVRAFGVPAVKVAALLSCESMIPQLVDAMSEDESTE